MIKTKLMGILNITPDSFFSGSRYPTLSEAIEGGLRLHAEGADFIDVGGESTRPWSQNISEQEELDRVIPVVEYLATRVENISIDTTKGCVARAAVKAGASLINDISGFRYEEMVQVAVESGVKICVMHMLGTPQTMQKDPFYQEGVVVHLLKWFEEKVAFLVAQGVKEESIIIDPGIGFGKNVADNLKILHNLPKLKELGFPVLLGISRKSFLSKILNKPPGELLPSTLAVNSFAIMSHVDIIRVHDVKEHRDIIEVLSAIN